MNSGPAFKRGLIFGTFDRLHEGHIDYMKLAFSLAAKVEIALMSNEASQPKKAYKVTAYTERKKAIEDLCQKNQWSKNRYRVFPFDRQVLCRRMMKQPLVDVVITGYEYLDYTYDMFKERENQGQEQFTIVVKPRLKVKGKEITSTSIQLGYWKD